MGKRSNFERNPRDYYRTPWAALVPEFLSHLSEDCVSFIEPCAGDGALVVMLEESGYGCAKAFDIEPQHPDITHGDALNYKVNTDADYFITNPPWDRKILHPLIVNLSDQLPTWLLFDADWVHTRQAAPLMPRLREIISVGRLIWMPGTKMTGKDNCAWHLFSAPMTTPTRFFGRGLQKT